MGGWRRWQGGRFPGDRSAGGKDGKLWIGDGDSGEVTDHSAQSVDSEGQVRRRSCGVGYGGALQVGRAACEGGPRVRQGDPEPERGQIARGLRVRQQAR